MSESTNTNEPIVMYTTNWCSDCFRAKYFFDNYGIKYTEVDLGSHPEAVETVLKLNNGMRSVPTIVFPDGTVLTEPSNQELAAQTGVEL